MHKVSGRSQRRRGVWPQSYRGLHRALRYERYVTNAPASAFWMSARVSGTP